MATLEELRRERDRLRNKRQSKQEIRAIGFERAKLKTEIRELKTPRRTAFKRAVGRGVRSTARGAGSFIEGLIAPSPPIKTVKRSRRRKKISTARRSISPARSLARRFR